MSAALRAFLETVQTSGPAPETDLFGRVPANEARGAVDAVLAFTGELVSDARICARACDLQGHMVPVVMLELAYVGAAHQRVHAEVPFTETTRHQAEACARKHRKGQTVTVYTQLSAIRMSLPRASLAPPDHPQP